MLVGIRPTIGRISRYGIIPITADHDTAGPMTRTVADAAIMMGALESPAPDPNDPATTTCTPPPGRDYTAFLRAGALKGARIGIPRAWYYDRITLTGDSSSRPEGHQHDDGYHGWARRPQSGAGQSDGGGDSPC
jgi:amidase